MSTKTVELTLAEAYERIAHLERQLDDVLALMNEHLAASKRLQAQTADLYSLLNRLSSAMRLAEQMVVGVA